MGALGVHDLVLVLQHFAARLGALATLLGPPLAASRFVVENRAHHLRDFLYRQPAAQQVEYNVLRDVTSGPVK
jgi:hypothetical protein